MKRVFPGGAGISTGGPGAGRQRALHPEPRESRASPVPKEGDRRRHPRHRVTLPVSLDLEGQDEPLRLYAMDISRGGLFIRASSPLPVGTKIEVRVELRKKRLFLVEAQVVHVLFDHHATSLGLASGMGVRFAAQSAGSGRTLEELAELARRCARDGEAMLVEPRDIDGSEQSAAAREAIREALKQAAYRAYGDAAATLEKLLRDEPDNGHARLWSHLVHARQLKELGDSSGSLERYQAILALDSQHREARREVRRLTGGFWRRLFRRS